MQSLPPDHFLALSRLDAFLGTSENVYDTSTLAAHDFDVDNRTGFMPPQVPPTRLPATWEPWELLLDSAVAERLGVMEAPRPRSADSCICITRPGPDFHVQLPVIPIAALLRSETDLRRAHLVLAWTMHFYIHSLPPDLPVIIPAPITIPLFQICAQLKIPPVLTYSDTVLYNWTLKTPSPSSTSTSTETENATPTPAPDNLRSATLFTGTRSEEEFYLTSARIELRGVAALDLMRATMDEAFVGDALAARRITLYLTRLASVIDDLRALIAGVRGGCDPGVFYNDIRPWFRGADSVTGRAWVFDGMDADPSFTYPAELSGPSAGQSALIHALDMFLGVDEFSHAPTLTGSSAGGGGGQKTKKSAFLVRMQLYMPRHHRNFLNHLAANPRPLRLLVSAHLTNTEEGEGEGEGEELRKAYNDAVGALKRFRDYHIGIVTSYIIQPARRARAALELANAQAALESAEKGEKAEAEKAEKEEKAKEKEKEAPLKGTGGTDLARFLKAVRDRTAAAVIS